MTHSGGTGLLEISAPGVTKAGTLAGLCEERGVDPAEVVAFGDMPNDLAVLAFAGAGYAMANAHHMVWRPSSGAPCRTTSTGWPPSWNASTPDRVEACDPLVTPLVVSPWRAWLLVSISLAS